MEFNLKVEFGFSFTDRRLRVGKTTDFELNAFRVRPLVRWLYDGDQGTNHGLILQLLQALLKFRCFSFVGLVFVLLTFKYRVSALARFVDQV